jgi:GT2 family glycosyltransferase
VEVAVKASIIVCTRDRCVRLEALLSSLAAAKPPQGMDLELVVVDDGSRDATGVTVKRFAATVDFPVHLLQQPGRGLAAARNRGLREARGDLIIFLDDDCVVSPNYFREVAARFAADDQPVFRGGRVVLGDPADAPLTIKTSPYTERLPERADPGGFILGCNMAMPRAVLAKVGMFDERFGAGAQLKSAEDTDYTLRVSLAGIRVEYVPDMTVYHHHGRRTAHEVGRVHRNYGIGNGALTMKHTLSAPWLWRSRYWTIRNAMKEMFGGPPFDPELGLSHAPIVAHNAIGACLFLLAKLRRAAPWPEPVDIEMVKAPARVA